MKPGTKRHHILKHVPIYRRQWHLKGCGHFVNNIICHQLIRYNLYPPHVYVFIERHHNDLAHIPNHRQIRGFSLMVRSYSVCRGHVGCLIRYGTG